MNDFDPIPVLPRGCSFLGRQLSGNTRNLNRKIVRSSLEALIESVPWHEKLQLMGLAENIPKALRALMSANAEEVTRAYWDLDNHVVVQGDLFDSAYFVVPILLQMLHDGIQVGRPQIYNLLFEIANGHGAPGATIPTPDGTDRPLREACLREVCRGVDLFRADLQHANSAIASTAADILSILQQHQNGDMPRAE